MPFVPLNPDEKKRWPKPCMSSEHLPPTMIVLRETCVWQCPACGKRTVIVVQGTRCKA